MKLGLLHLSDIHIKDANATVLDKAVRIVRAVRQLFAVCDHIAVVITGDIAFSGKASEYVIASKFLDSLRSAFATTLSNVSVSFVIAPGNHDCDFDTLLVDARTILVDAARRDPLRAADQGIVQICTEVQSAFFQFRDSLAKPQSAHSPLLYEYLITSGDAAIRFRCLNTAWMSQKTEIQGTLTFPHISAVRSATDASFVITLMHHPYIWFEADHCRMLRRELETHSDLILTGHEHTADAHSKVTYDGAVFTEFVEGAVLQDSSDPDRSGFNAVLLDFAERRRRLETFRWETDLYKSQSRQDNSLQLNGALRRRPFAFSDAFAKFLEDPGVSLTHRAKALVTLDDIFVWPNVREINYGRRRTKPLFSSSELPSTIRRDKLVIITGAERAGKTTLCKQLCKLFRHEGLVPLFFSCSQGGSLTAANAEATLCKTFQQQYDPQDLDRYKQFATSEKVLILDDIDRSGLPRAEKLKLLKQLSTMVDHLVVTASDLTHDLEGIVYSSAAHDAEIDFHPYRLQEFGHYLRHSLIEKWFAIGTDHVTAADRLSQEWAQVRRTIDTVVGKNFVPSYPVFILSILQAFEAARPVDTNASTYGYFYEVLVREALQASRGDAETKNEYLARLARYMFDRQMASVTEKELRDFHAAYEREMDLSVPFVRLVADLKNCRILETDGATYRFAYRYIYYYFVATHMRDRIGEQATRHSIADMSSKLHVEEYANIMLFLAHVCRDPYVIDTLLQQARRIYCAVSPARLEDDVAFANKSETDFEYKYVDGDVTVSRRRMLSDLDELDQESPDSEDGTDSVCTDADYEHLDPVLRLNVALKTIQILGQMLRNFAGSIVGDTKVVIAEECYLLGLRTLSAVLQLMRENEEDVVAMMFGILRKEYPSAKDDALFEKAKGAVFWLAQIFSYAMVKKVAYAVGSERLVQTYRRVRERTNSAAVSLVDVSLKLDHLAMPPENEIISLNRRLTDNPLANSLRRQLVIHHFYMFDVHYEIKQRLCAKLKIPYETVQTADRRQRLVVAPAFKTPKLLTSGMS